MTKRAALQCLLCMGEKYCRGLMGENHKVDATGSRLAAVNADVFAFDICSFLDAHSLLNLGSTCQALRQLARSHRTWARMCQQVSPCSASFIQEKGMSS